MTSYRRDGRTETTLSIKTKVPEKWLFVDQETGDVWEWDVDQDKFVRALLNVLVLPQLRPRSSVG